VELYRLVTIYNLMLHTSRLLATDLNTETVTSNRYEVFLSFRLQSFWNLGTQLKIILSSESESESESLCDWQSVSLSVLVSSPVWGSWPDIHFDWKLHSCPYGAPFLTRGRVCHLLFLAASGLVLYSLGTGCDVSASARKCAYRVVAWKQVA
jgi:hypothetical protein